MGWIKSAGKLGIQGFVWKTLGASGSEHEFEAEDLLYRLIDTYGESKQDDQKLVRDGTGQGHYNSFVHVLTTGA